MGGGLKQAKDLAPGDRIAGKGLGIFTVLSVAPSVQVVRRPVILVTVRTQSGRVLHRTYGAYSSVALDLSPGGSEH